MRNLVKSSLLAGMVAFAAGSVPAFAGSTLITFTEFPAGTVITNQYAADGVIFSGVSGNAPIIAPDGAVPYSPTLSPNPPYAGDFKFTFIHGATGVSFDSGYWDSLGSGVVDVYSTSHTLLAALSNTSTGVDHFNLSSYGKIGSVYFNSFNDPAGADIGNLAFTGVPELSTWAMMLVGFAALGFSGYRSRKTASVAA